LRWQEIRAGDFIKFRPPDRITRIGETQKIPNLPLDAIFFYSVYIFLDFYLSPENVSLFIVIRIGIVFPLFGVCISKGNDGVTMVDDKQRIVVLPWQLTNQQKTNEKIKEGSCTR